MFTGIIETVGAIKSIIEEGSNFHFEIASSISHELKVDQSVAHNGVCLTVTAVSDDTHKVTAIHETVSKTAITDWKVGTHINLERCLAMNARLDGHMVQGHVDTTGQITNITAMDGSYLLTIDYRDASYQPLLVPQGSVCINGISLTVARLEGTSLGVAIIPYTWEHTDLKFIKAHSSVNIEFDILGKYILRNLQLENHRKRTSENFSS
ncbi:MAG: riboflavin synthase [Bacteroidota bacterium]